ncbi:MAG: dihydroorotate dehydrogenase electron transfer subunit [Treponema sp.]|jgi:NAD(P)H-flavin reductase|nr:dihydroorotate dehydrogenase electron transfer subunit [Treponema sp.]
MFPKAGVRCNVESNSQISGVFFRLEVAWPGAVPQPGQFFMCRLLPSAVFLPRAISFETFYIDPGGAKRLSFLIARKGKATEAFALLKKGDVVELRGPLGNSWLTVMPRNPPKPIALIGGNAGIAPLTALACAVKAQNLFHFYAGFRTEKNTLPLALLLTPAAASAVIACIASEAGKPRKKMFGAERVKGRIPDFVNYTGYSAVFACGSGPMLAAIAGHCRQSSTPCYVSLERPMACGTGACLGCAVQTRNGNKRCCVEGPIFPAEELVFE